MKACGVVKVCRLMVSLTLRPPCFGVTPSAAGWIEVWVKVKVKFTLEKAEKVPEGE